VHVWLTALDRPVDDVHALAGVLSADEHARAGRFRFERDRRRFVVARAALRAILGWCLGRDPRRLRFSYGRFGKPHLAPELRDRRICFNLSHAHDRALIAVAHGRELGVDLELVRPIADLPLIARRSFSARVNAELRSLGADEALRGFFSCWTRKEAVQKAIGRGLGASLDHFDVPVHPGPGPFLTVQAAGRRWNLIDLEPHPDFAAALAAQGRGPRVRTWLWPS
jgi:4'-phosphopantetheinyl transferase